MTNPLRSTCGGESERRQIAGVFAGTSDRSSGTPRPCLPQRREAAATQAGKSTALSKLMSGLSAKIVRKRTPVGRRVTETDLPIALLACRDTPQSANAQTSSSYSSG